MLPDIEDFQTISFQSRGKTYRRFFNSVFPIGWPLDSGKLTYWELSETGRSGAIPEDRKNRACAAYRS